MLVPCHCTVFGGVLSFVLSYLSRHPTSPHLAVNIPDLLSSKTPLPFPIDRYLLSTFLPGNNQVVRRNCKQCPYSEHGRLWMGKGEGDVSSPATPLMHPTLSDMASRTHR